MAFRLVETRRQAVLVETSYVKLSKVSFLSRQSRTVSLLLLQPKDSCRLYGDVSIQLADSRLIGTKFTFRVNHA
jgi:hypothetical protein